jgi:predicted RNase H-like nuclease
VSRSARVAGVDGCRGGWAVVEVALRRGAPSRVARVDSIGPLVARARRGELAAVGIDMPIGLPDGDRRAADVEARARLGTRRSSVFPTPARAVLGASDYPDALARSRAATGRGLSRQAFHLLGRIAEVDRAVRPADQRRVVEVHPESCFAVLAGAPLAEPKRSAAGRAARLALLVPHFPDVADHVGHRPAGVAVDDLLDAFAVAWTARRVARGRAERLGDGALDARGLRMEIVV